MLTITKDASVETVITTFETTPGICQDLVDELQKTFSEFVSKQPGFIGSALHVNYAQTRVANYSQWQRREDFQAMLRSDQMRECSRKINTMCRGFEPVMYEVWSVMG